MENLTYKALKEAIEETYTKEYKASREIILLRAAEAYLPILLRQEFVKPNEPLILGTKGEMENSKDLLDVFLNPNEHGNTDK